MNCHYNLGLFLYENGVLPVYKSQQKTLQPCYLYNKNPYTLKMISILKQSSPDHPPVLQWNHIHSPVLKFLFWLCFYQTISAWSVDQGSANGSSTLYHFAPTDTKFYDLQEGQVLSYNTKFNKCMHEIADRKVIFTWSLIHGSSWSSFII